MRIFEGKNMIIHKRKIYIEKNLHYIDKDSFFSKETKLYKCIEFDISF